MAQPYKALKEDFVSNLSGGEVSEINAVTAIAPVALLLWSSLQSRREYFTPYNSIAFFADFLLNVGAILLAITLYSSNPMTLNLLLILPVFLLQVYPFQNSRRRKASKILSTKREETTVAPPKNGLDPLPIRPFVTAYRGTMMIVTCLAILAVDFEIFPRRFAKVETWGTSLMDVGVGSFVFSAGFVSARSFLKDRLTKDAPLIRSRFFSSLKHSLPLILLGFVRLYSVKSLNLAEHVTEYGVHWNFFFTLALLPPSVVLLQPLLVTPPLISLLSLLLGCVYESILKFTVLEAYILTSPRTNLLSQNREGVFSYCGYLAIFIAGHALGLDVLPRMVGKNEKTIAAGKLRRDLLKRLVSHSIVWILLTFLATSHKYGLNLTVSRRLANLSYIVWVAAFNCTQITLFCVIETLFFPNVYKANDKLRESIEIERATSRILRAFNRNGLAIFLLANPLTGFVNLTFNTLTVTRAGAMGILVAYAALLTIVAVTLDRWNITIKL